MRGPARKLAALAVLSLAAGAALAQDTIEGFDGLPAEEREEWQKLSDLEAKAAPELDDKKTDVALADLKKVLDLLSASKLPRDATEPLASNAHYNHACALALSGKKEGALEALARAIDAGFYDWAHVDEDPDLASIRGEAAFKKTIDAGKAAEKARIEAEEKALPDAARKALAGKPLCTLKLDATALDGKKVSLAALKGKVVVLSYFAPAEDLVELASLVKLHAAWKEKGVQVVGVTSSDDPGLADFVKESGIVYPVLKVGAKDAVLKPSIVWNAKLLFLDRDGNPRARALHARRLEAFEATVKALLEPQGK